MAAELVTTTELDAYLSGDSDSALTKAEAAVRAYCRWHVAPVKPDTVTLWGVGDGVLLLPSLHVVSVESVTVDGEPVTDFEWREHGTLHGAGWRGRVEVSFTHGYDAESPAFEVVRGTILAVAARAKVSPSGVVRAQVGQVSETYTQTGFNQAGGVSLIDVEKVTLDAYRLHARP